MPGEGRKELKYLRRYGFLLVVAALVVAADRLSKRYVESRFGVGYGPRQIIDHLLELRVIQNRGAAFGLFQDFTWGLLIISVAVLAGILFYYAWLNERDWPARLGLALIFGGALSTAYDRGIKGSVIDFIQLPYWPIFNLADSAISVGVVLLVVSTFLRSRHPRPA